jgi:hypothetical protein
MTQMRHGAFLATIDLTEFGFAARAASSIPLTDARLRVAPMPPHPHS